MSSVLKQRTRKTTQEVACALAKISLADTFTEVTCLCCNRSHIYKEVYETLPKRIYGVQHSNH
jgi:hypothetical protein